MKLFDLDKNGSVTAKPEHFEQAILFAKKNKVSGIWIRSDMNKKIDAPRLDFELLKEIPFISKFGFSEDVTLKRIDNIEGIYSLQNLTSLTFYEINYDLNFEAFPNLEGLATKLSKKYKNIDAVKKLDRLSLISVDKDLTLPQSLQSIRYLKLTKGAILSLDGIKQFTNLEDIELFYLTKLINCDAIKNFKKLKRLYIEKCTKINDFNFLENNNTIKELFVSDIDTISFVASMKNLEELKFWSLKDGDMSPVLKSKSIKEVNFSPDKKHYSHSKQEINSLIN